MGRKQLIELSYRRQKKHLRRKRSRKMLKMTLRQWLPGGS
jgi:hypothetical protein